MVPDDYGYELWADGRHLLTVSPDMYDDDPHRFQFALLALTLKIEQLEATYTPWQLYKIHRELVKEG